MTMNRRKFLKAFGMGAAGAASVAVTGKATMAVVADEPLTKDSPPNQVVEFDLKAYVEDAFSQKRSTYLRRPMRVVKCELVSARGGKVFVDVVASHKGQKYREQRSVYPRGPEHHVRAELDTIVKLIEAQATRDARARHHRWSE